MQGTVRNRYDASRNFDQKMLQAACYAPFVSLYFNSSGNVLACCKNDTFLLGNITNQSLKEIWNGPRIKQLRQALQDYRFEAGCEFCEWQIGEGNDSPSFPTLFEEFPVPSSAPEWPAMIEFAGSNTCNFECIMCYGELSSSIRTHRDGLPPLPKYYSERFFEELREFLPHLKRAKFLGGEPFLASETHQIWEMMIELNLRIPCHVTTNASQYNEKIERVLDFLPVSITVSMDGRTKETFEKIRLNSKYEEVLKNLLSFRKYTKKKGTFFSIAFCLMRQNWHEFVDMLIFAEELDCELFVNTVTSPSDCSLYTLSQNEIKKISEDIEQRGIPLQNRFLKNRKVWQDAIADLRGRSNDPAPGRITRSYYRLEDYFPEASRLANHGRKEEALEYLRTIPKNDPSFYQAVTYCGEIQREMGDFAGALNDLEQAIKISAKRPEALFYLARLQFQEGRFQEALKSAVRASFLVKQEDPLEQEIQQLVLQIRANSG